MTRRLEIFRSNEGEEATFEGAQFLPLRRHLRISALQSSENGMDFLLGKVENIGDALLRPETELTREPRADQSARKEGGNR